MVHCVYVDPQPSRRFASWMEMARCGYAGIGTGILRRALVWSAPSMHLVRTFCSGLGSMLSASRLYA